MAYKLKQENYEKAPSAEMKKLFRVAWKNEIALPPTRILVSLRIKEILKGPEGALRKEQLNVWRAEREAQRAARKLEAEANSHA